MLGHRPVPRSRAEENARVRPARLLADRCLDAATRPAGALGRGLLRPDGATAPARPATPRAGPPVRRGGRDAPHPAAAGDNRGHARYRHPHLADPRAAAPISSPELVRDEIGDGAGEVRARSLAGPDRRARGRSGVRGAARVGRGRGGVRRPPCTTSASWPPSPPTWSPGDGSCRSRWTIRRGRSGGRCSPDPTPPGPGCWPRRCRRRSPPAIPDQSLTVWADALDALVDAAARAALGPLRLSLGRAGTPATRAWLAALTGTERTFAAEPAAGRRPRRAPSAAGSATPSPARSGRASGWSSRRRRTRTGSVQFGLQAADEPSLVVDADAVWRSRGKLPRAGPPPRRPAGDPAGRAGQGQPALSRAGRRAAHRPPDRAAAGHRRRAPLPEHARRRWPRPVSACCCPAGGPGRRPGSACG